MASVSTILQNGTALVSPATVAPSEVVASGATLLPFTADNLTISSNEPVTSTQLIAGVVVNTFVSDPTLTTDVGHFADTAGGGALTGGTTSGNGILEINGLATTPGNTILGRMQFIAPTLKPGQSMEDNLVLETATSLTPGGAIDSNVAVAIIPIDVVTAPAITGAVPMQPDGDAVIQPFATMAIADTDFKNTGLDGATITVTDPAGTPTDADGILTGVGLSKTGVGTYSVPNPVSALTMEAVLKNLKFTPVVQGPTTTTNFEVDVTDTKAALTSKDTTTSVITTGNGMITPPPGGDLTVVDTTTGATVPTVAPAVPAEAPYPGPVVGPTEQYINVTEDSLNITAKTPNWFIHSGSGTDAIQAFGGTNVLDGGTGSNFLMGATGTGHDTFFVDDRNPTGDIWSTVANFHPGDDATVFGITPAMFNISMADNQGATGFTGLTFHATAAGKPTASLTIVGASQADLADGKATQTFGTESDGTPFMLIHAT